MVQLNQNPGPTAMGPRFLRSRHQRATVLMRSIISSTAFSTGTFSFNTRFIALAQTFSLLSWVNLKFLVNSKGLVPFMNWV